MANKNQGFDAGDDSAADDRGNQSAAVSSAYVPDENSQLARGPAHQTYFADEKVQIPDIDKVSVFMCTNNYLFRHV